MAISASRHKSRSTLTRHRTRRRSNKSRLVNIANDSNSPSTPTPNSEPSTPSSSSPVFADRRTKCAVVGREGRAPLAVVHANAISGARRPLARLPTRGKKTKMPSVKEKEHRSEGRANVKKARIAVLSETDEQVQSLAGRKRKRGAVAAAQGRKRRKENVHARVSDDAMDVDDEDNWVASTPAADDEEEEEADDGAGASQDAPIDASDDFLITSALPWQLHRLRKDDLIRLYTLSSPAESQSGSQGRTDLPDADALEAWTKTELVDALIAARDMVAERSVQTATSRRSSSRSRTSTPPKTATSEHTTAHKKTRPHRTVRVRLSTPPPSSSAVTSDEVGEGDEDADGEAAEATPIVRRPSRTLTKPARQLTRRATVVPAPSPPVTRHNGTAAPFGAFARSKSMNDIAAAKRGRAPGRGRGKRGASAGGKSGSGSGRSNDAAETEGIRARLRRRQVKEGESADGERSRRRTLYRTAKGRVGSLKESSEDEEAAEEEEEEEEEEPEAQDGGEEEEDGGDEEEDGGDEAGGWVDEDDEAEEEEEDDPTPMRAPTRRTRAAPNGGGRVGRLTRSRSAAGGLRTPVTSPIKKRLRPRMRSPIEEEEVGDGDDEEDVEQEKADEEVDEEEEGGEDVAASEEDASVEVDEEEEEGGDEEVVEVDDEEEDEEVAEEEVAEEAEEEEEEVVEVDRYGNPIELVEDDEDEDVEVDEIDGSEEGDAVDVDAVEDEVMEDAYADADEDVDDEMNVSLLGATVKSLTRLRRDDLVHLCEAHELEPIGTKPQLAQALLEWRDTHRSEAATSSAAPSSFRSTPSSSSTARPRTPTGATRKGSFNSKSRSHPRGRDRDVPRTPILLRSHHVHGSQPQTPEPSHGGTPIAPTPAHNEPELDLDLEELGLEEKEIPPEKLTKLEKIGSGGFKDVFVGKYKNRKVAIAEIRGQLSSMDIKELTLLRDFDHPNIVRFLGVSVPENTRETPVMIVSELCANGDLYDYIRNVPPPSLKKVLNIMLDIANGLVYLHERKPSVIHRDCKSSNILITGGARAKIADFGLAKVKQSTRSMVRSLVGTVNWQAPELWHAHPKYDYKVDVFSCAMVFWEMLQWHNPNKKYPWEGMNEHAIYEAVGAKKQRPSISGLRKQWNSDVVTLVEHMWAQEPQDRPSMVEVRDELRRIIAEL